MANTEKAKELELTKKNDFVEIDFLGRNLTNNEIFDTNILEEAKKLNTDAKEEDIKKSIKPLAVCIGQDMVVKGLDEALESKEIGKKYSIKLTPEKAFGKRNPQMVRLIPMRIFQEQKIYPEKGMTFALDNTLIKVISVSGGRVMADFNNPLAGKDVEFEFTIKKILPNTLEGTKEKVNALQTFLFNQIFEFDIQDEKEGKSKKIIFKDVKLTPILNAFKDKFKEILGYDIEIFQKVDKTQKFEQEEKTDKAEKREKTEKKEGKTSKKEEKKTEEVRK